MHNPIVLGFASAALLSLSMTPALAQEEEQEQKPIQTVGDIVDQPGVLTPKGRLIVDSTLSYAQSASNRVSVVGYSVLPTLVVGFIEVEEADRTTLSYGLALRYGITNRLEAEIRVPFIYRNETYERRELASAQNDTTIYRIEGHGVGDAEVGLRYQFNMDSAPFFVGGIRAKSTTGRSPYESDYNQGSNSFEETPTGSGFWSIEPHITLIYPTAPVVLYASLGYVYNFEDEVTLFDDSVADVKLGDSVSISAGMGFAVNPKFSFSLGVSHRTIFESETNGSSSGSQLIHIDQISFGTQLSLTPSTSLNISASAGLTEDSPDFQLNLSVPVAF
jgi:hypothetical protein